MHDNSDNSLNFENLFLQKFYIDQQDLSILKSRHQSLQLSSFFCWEDQENTRSFEGAVYNKESVKTDKSSQILRTKINSNKLVEARNANKYQNNLEAKSKGFNRGRKKESSRVMGTRNRRIQDIFHKHYCKKQTKKNISSSDKGNESRPSTGNRNSNCLDLKNIKLEPRNNLKKRAFNEINLIQSNLVEKKSILNILFIIKQCQFFIEYKKIRLVFY